MSWLEMNGWGRKKSDFLHQLEKKKEINVFFYDTPVEITIYESMKKRIRIFVSGECDSIANVV